MINELDELHEAFVDQIIWNDMLVLRLPDAVRFIERAKAAGRRVLGIEGFRIVVALVEPPLHTLSIHGASDGCISKRTGIQPSLEHSLDLTRGDGRVEDTWAVAVAFVEEHAAAVDGFELVVESGRDSEPAPVTCRCSRRAAIR